MEIVLQMLEMNSDRIYKNLSISIVTVCYNAGRVIDNTIVSVLNQTYKNIDYVIIDGASTDETLSYVEKYKYDSRVTVVSEPDTGIYNAMNKSLDIITGDYVIFMNAGDTFYDQHVIEDIVESMFADIVYGDVCRVMNGSEKIQKYRGTHCERMIDLLSGLNMCHQSQFTRVDIMRKYEFDEKYRIVADYDFVARAMRDRLSFQHVNRVICKYDNCGGVSAQENNYLQMIHDDDEIIKACFPVWYMIIKIPKKIYRKIMRKI